jgi:hypothetical protein
MGNEGQSPIRVRVARALPTSNRTPIPRGSWGKKSGHLPIPCVSGENSGAVTGLDAARIVLRELGWFYDDPHEQPPRP